MKSTAGRKYPWLPYLECILIFILILGIDGSLGPELGFPGMQRLPYIGLLLLFGVFYGIPLVLFATSLVGISNFIVFPFLQSSTIPEIDFVYFALFFLGGVGAGARIDSLKGSLGAYRSRMREIIHREWNIQKQNRVLIRVQNELEERVVRQSDSLVLLSRQLRLLERSDLNQALQVLLETVQIYSKCSQASIWVLDKETSDLTLTVTLGYDAEDRPPAFLALEKNPQSWALKNLELYSVRAIQTNHEIAAYDDGKTIMAMPITLSQGPWAVLSIDTMPFEKCNPYTETFLQLIVRLAEPGIRKIYELERLYSHRETNDQTGIPFFSLLLRTMPSHFRKAKDENIDISVLIIELLGKTSDKFEERIIAFEKYLRRVLPTDAQLYHYKSDDQLIVVIPDLSEDGIALLAVNLLSTPGVDETILGEFILGYSTYHPGDEENPSRLFASAEQLIEIQRV